MNDAGRPQLAYGKQARDCELEHEYLITETELLLGGPFERNAAVGKTVADGLLIRNGVRLYVEVDNESMSPKQMREKWMRYENTEGFILLICRTKGRLKRLIRSAERVKTFILFSRFAWLKYENVNEKWIDWYGKRASV